MKDDRACAREEKHEGFEKYKCFNLSIPISLSDIAAKRRKNIRNDAKATIVQELIRSNKKLIAVKHRFTRKYNNVIFGTIFCIIYMVYYE